MGERCEPAQHSGAGKTMPAVGDMPQRLAGRLGHIPQSVAMRLAWVLQVIDFKGEVHLARLLQEGVCVAVGHANHPFTGAFP